MMIDLLTSSGFFAIVLTLAAFLIGRFCQEKGKRAVFNPILIGAVLVMLVLWALDVPLEQYQQDCKALSFWMIPATICLAIGFYEQLQSLKKHLGAIALGVTAGTMASLLSVWGMCKVFGFSQVLTVSMLPKSVTTAIGVAISDQAGGIGAVTTAAIILTGILGNIAGPMLAKIFRLEDPVSQGVAYGTASHVIGTSRATEVSQMTGAVSSLALTLAGLLTVVFLSFAL